MKIFASFVLKRMRKRRRKLRVFEGKTAASASYEARPIHTYDALRDGASCPERRGDEAHVGKGAHQVKRLAVIIRT
jgi:hypothetical protein